MKGTEENLKQRGGRVVGVWRDDPPPANQRIREMTNQPVTTMAFKVGYENISNIQCCHFFVTVVELDKYPPCDIFSSKLKTEHTTLLSQ